MPYRKGIQPANTLTLETFIERADKVYNGRYDYSDSEYISSHIKIAIRCKLHDLVFNQLGWDHLGGHEGCPTCASIAISKRLTWTTEKFITEARKVHGDRYDYGKVVYVSTKERVIITCKKHGDFLQKPCHHINNECHCQKCALELIGDLKRKSLDQLILDARAIHGDRYDYSEIKTYKNGSTKAPIRCKIHGIFWMNPQDHIGVLSSDCPDCALADQRQRAIDSRKTTEEFVAQSKMVHGEKYDYSEVEYTTNHHKVKVICGKHGPFWIEPWSHHGAGQGCGACSSKVSNVSEEWLDIVGVPRGVEYREVRLTINKRNIWVDGYIENTKTCYEFLGSFFHGDPTIYNPEDENPLNYYTYGELYQRWLARQKLILDAGYNLIYIWESEWNDWKSYTDFDDLDDDENPFVSSNPFSFYLQ